MSSQSSPIVEAPQPQVERHIMRRDEVERKTGFKRAHIYNLMKEGTTHRRDNGGAQAVAVQQPTSIWIRWGSPAPPQVSIQQKTIQKAS